MIEALVRQFLYYPTRLDVDAPLPSYVRGAQEVWIDTASDTKTHGLYWPAEPERPTVLFLHGNAQSVFEWALVREDLAALDCGLLLIDYPGYGKTPGSPREEGLFASGRAALKWLEKEKAVPSSHIIVFGKSLGGGVASEVVSGGKTVMGLVLESTFRSIPHVAQRLLPMLPIGGYFASEVYNTEAKLPEIHVPVLVVHGTLDELIAVEEGKALHLAANEPKELYLVSGAGHNDVAIRAGASYGQRLRQWMDGLAQ